MKKLILVLLILAGITEGCQNYEEGPWISFRKPTRKIHGTYLLTKYDVDGTDSLSLYTDSLPTGYNFYYSALNEKEIFRIEGLRNDGKDLMIECKYDLINNNKTIQVVLTSGITGTGPIGRGKTPAWDILRLTNKEMKIKTNYNNKEYVIGLNKSSIVVI